MSMLLRKHVKIYLADNFPLKVAENHFVEKKSLSKNGGYHPPPPNGKSLKKDGSKRAKISIFWPKIAVF